MSTSLEFDSQKRIAVLMLHNFMFLGGHVSDMHVCVSPEPQPRAFLVILESLSPFCVVLKDYDLIMRNLVEGSYLMKLPHEASVFRDKKNTAWNKGR